MIKKIVIIVFICITSTLSADPLTWVSGRMDSLGGPSVADGKTFSARFYNPAYFASDENQTLFSDTSLGISGLSEGVVDVIKDKEYYKLLPIDEGSYFKADLSGPLNSGFIKDNAGFRVYNKLDLLSFTPNLAVASSLKLNDQLVFQGGLGRNIPLPERWRGKASWGVLGKFFLEWDYRYAEDTVKFLYSLTNPSLLLDNPLNLKTGIGFDLGTVYELSDRFSFGLTIHDAFTPYGDFVYEDLDDYGQSLGYSHTEFGLKPIVVSTGMKFSSQFFKDRPVITSWDFFVDYRDIFAFAYDDSVNPILNLGLGTELTMFKFLDARVGFNEGLFSFGTAMNFKYWGLGISIYGNELSNEPGVFSVYSAKLNIEFHK